ncbi:MAG: thioredoxin domain-containing protein [Gemmatimonadaceae bacterium]
MPRSVSVRHLAAALALVATAACARSEEKPAEKTVANAGGEVAAAPAANAGMAGALTDSTSARADRGRIRGSEQAQVWLVEVSDFQCPFCKRWHDESFAALDKEYVQTGKVRLAYLNYPIASLHPNAHAASEAAMCASVQGKFWELHSSLFVTQERWAKLPDPTPFFDSLATAAKVDAAEWRKCVTSHATVPLINADKDRSGASGVQSTPTFFVGNRKILGAYPLDTFRVVLNAELAKARGGK